MFQTEFLYTSLYGVKYLGWYKRHPYTEVASQIRSAEGTLVDSQFGELEKSSRHAYPQGKPPVTFQGYTGQEGGERCLGSFSTHRKSGLSLQPRCNSTRATASLDRERCQPVRRPPRRVSEGKRTTWSWSVMPWESRARKADDTDAIAAEGRRGASVRLHSYYLSSHSEKPCAAGRIVMTEV